ncbi:MAG: selenocysteine-specific translation elongation factor [Deltaproteobacteria bacterium]|nr:selenocysteine-specific translation elongation factor [Deltaproteobacteria bacterium]
MKQIILGTAGHIDHGKTSLIKAVTGTDTDRLKEEKLRGITIELGFASLELPGGQHVGVVDVPGHEKFIKNMVAGATGIDIVVMVIAADEGVMPQTREHLEICSLLDIKYGFIVLNKVDLVDEEWLELVKEDTADFLKGTFLEGTPMVPVSAVTGQGIQEFIKTLEDLSSLIPERSISGLFRLPVDRVFSMKGFGTVITGTLISGHVSVGDAVQIYPSMVSSNVRGIQVHNKTVNTAEAGMRTAINFKGLEKTSINRGEMLGKPGEMKSSYMIDVSLQFLTINKKPMKNRTRVRFHAGTSEILGIIALLEKDEIAPGETSVVQIRLDSPVTVVKDDRFVIRSYSPIRTIGGGRVLNPIPKKHKGFKPEVIKGLNGLMNNTPEEIVEYCVNQSSHKGVNYADLRIMTNLADKQLQSIISGLLSKRILICTDKDNRLYIHNNTFEKIKNEILQVLENYHKINLLKTGMSKEELKTKFPLIMGSKLFNLIIIQMEKKDEIISEDDTVRLSGHSISLGADQAELKKKILEIYKKTGLKPPYFRDIPDQLKIDVQSAKDVLMLLIEENMIIKAKDDLYFDRDAVDMLKKRLIDFFDANMELTTPNFKDIAGVSRKYLIPLIEYFDSINLTIRIGDIRKLRNK